MDRLIKEHRRGGAGIMVVFFCLMILGCIFLVNVFQIGMIKQSRGRLQNIVDLAANRAALEVDYATNGYAEALGEGLGFDGSKENCNIRIAKDAAKAKFCEIFTDNTGVTLTASEVLLLTPVNIMDSGAFEYYLEGLDSVARSESATVAEVSTAIESYLGTKVGSSVDLYLETQAFDKATYIAVLKYDAGIVRDGGFIIRSFGGAQVFRR